VVTGLPVVMVTTTGARTGKQRTMPLLGIPIGDDVALIGGNFGQTTAPGWVYNLTADGAATISYRNASVDVTARLANDVETDETFALAAPIYGGYAKYLERTTHRDTKVFILEIPS
jgi:deazaflavin-dependent oxidoreductase (nitroreductase family)